VGYHLIIDVGYDDKYNDKGNQISLGGGTISVCESSDGDAVHRDAKIKVTDAIVEVIDDKTNIPSSIGGGSWKVFVTGGDHESLVAVQVAGESDTFRDLVAALVSALKDKGYTKIDLSDYIASMPSVTQGDPTLNADGSVTQNATLTVPAPFYALVKLTHGAGIQQGFVLVVKADVRSKDGESTVKTFPVTIKAAD
jgi:hypothetical protein